MKCGLGSPRDVYRAISNDISKYGIFHKCLFHLHTPASYDYIFFEDYKDKNLKSIEKKVTDLFLFNKCVELGILPSDRKNLYSQNNEDGIFSNEREFWAFLLIADRIIRNKIELIVISDHNTIEGYDKLCKTIEILYENNHLGIKTNKFYPTTILGIELSCADKNHVVAIFDDCNDEVKKKSKKNIQGFLEEYLMNEDEGLYITANEVIDKICEMRGIPYIAHINSSSMFSENEKFMSGAYKKKLLANPNFHIAGISDITSENIIRNKIEKESNRKFCILLDSDAHSIDAIPQKIFWIKGQQCNFKMIHSALMDSKMAVSLEKPKSPKIFIEGLLIEGSKGFLNDGDNTKDFVITFSDALNCLIGGRGTGKSTILSILELVLAQRFNNVSIYEAIGKYESIWILCHLNEKKYLLLFAPLRAEYEDCASIKTLVNNIYGRYRFDEIIKKIERNDSEIKRLIKEILLKKCMTIYDVKDDGNWEEYRKSKKSLMEKIFGEGYVINRLVNIAENGTISQYIMETMNIQKIFPKISNGYQIFFNEYEKILSEREKAVNIYLETFNNQPAQKGKLRIRYERIENIGDFIDFESILRMSNKFKSYSKKLSKKYFNGYNITFEGVSDFLYTCSEKNIITFLKLMFNKNYEDISKIADIENFCEPFTSDMVDNNFQNVQNNPIAVIKLIIDEVINLGKSEITKKFPKKYIESTEEFVLEFNVESKSTSPNNKKPNFLEIRKLSQGQKVVAMLSFILGYSAYIKDERPLIVDQPEDNLDNQYIYETLVKTIRDVKLQKQIIMATHNATIVTNARTEKVVVLDSNGENGKVLDTGYSDERKIKKHIINYLEGGIEAFKMKCLIYDDILKSSK